MAKDSCPEGPNESIFKPGSATKMPTKHYPSTTAMTQKGKHNTIDGPGNEGKIKK